MTRSGRPRVIFLFCVLVEQAFKPAQRGLGRTGKRILNFLNAVQQLGTLGIFYRPVGSGACRTIRNRKVAGETKVIAIGVGHDHHVSVAACRQFAKTDLAVQRLEGKACRIGRCLRRDHSLVIFIPSSRRLSGEDATAL